MNQAWKAQMNLRAMDAVFPIREKSVNLIKILNESTPEEREKSVNRIESFSELSLQVVDEYWSSESSSNGSEMNSAATQF